MNFNMQTGKATGMIEIKEEEDVEKMLDLLDMVRDDMPYADSCLIAYYSVRYAEALAPIILKYAMRKEGSE